MAKFSKEVLPNGLRVVIEQTKERSSIHVGLFLLWGSRNEQSHQSGAAHLIEHMVFKGTKNRTAYEIVKDIESVGGEIGASTGKEVTNYTVQCLKKDLKLALEVLSDLVFQAEFTQAEFEKEQEVVLSEVAMSEENFEESVFDLAFEEIYKGHALGRPILGSQESIKNFKMDELFEIYKTEYQPSRMVLSVSGDVDSEQVTKWAQTYFGQNKNLNPRSQLSKATFQDGLKFVQKHSEQSHVLVSFPAPAFSDQDRLLSYLVNVALGGGMTSLLYQKVREELGLAYSVYSYLQCFLKEGVQSVYVGAKPEKALEVLDLVLSEVETLVLKGLSENQFDLYKQQLLGEVLMGQDDLEERMHSMAINELVFGEYKSPDFVAEKIKAITCEQCNAFVKKHFNHKPHIIILGPKKETS